MRLSGCADRAHDALTPAVTGIAADRAMRSKALSVNEVFAKLSAKASMCCVWADAAREPALAYERSASTAHQKGLLAQNVPSNCLLALSCAPGCLAPSSARAGGADGEATGAFARALLAHALQPGQPLPAALAQAHDQLAQETNGRQTLWVCNTLSSTASAQSDALCLVPLAPAGDGAQFYQSPEDAALEAAAAKDAMSALDAAERAASLPAAAALLAAAVDGPASRVVLPRACLVLGRIAAAMAATSGRTSAEATAGFRALVAACRASQGTTAGARTGALELCLNATWAMSHLLALGGSTSSTRQRQQEAAVAAGCCESALAALRAHGAASASISACACRVVELLCVDSAGSCARVRDQGCIELLLSTAAHHRDGDGPACLASLAALAVLCRDVECRRRAVALGVVAQAVGCCSSACLCGRHALSACEALRLLRVLCQCPGAARAAALHAGALAAAVACLTAHPQEPQLAEQALWVVCLLTSQPSSPQSGDPPTGATATAAQGADVAAVQAVAAALRSHTATAAVQALACRAMRNLTADSRNEAAATQLGFFEGLVESVTHQRAGAEQARSMDARLEVAARRGAAREGGAEEALKAALARHGDGAGSRFVAAAAALALEESSIRA